MADQEWKRKYFPFNQEIFFTILFETCEHSNSKIWGITMHVGDRYMRFRKMVWISRSVGICISRSISPSQQWVVDAQVDECAEVDFEHWIEVPRKSRLRLHWACACLHQCDALQDAQNSNQDECNLGRSCKPALQHALCRLRFRLLWVGHSVAVGPLMPRDLFEVEVVEQT